MTINHTHYWTDRRLHVEGHGPEGPFVVALNAPYAIIGNYEKAHVRLPADGVARRHLFALATDEGIYLMNFVDGRRQKKQDGFWLKPNEVIHVGEYTLRFGLANQIAIAKTPAVGLLERTVLRPFPMLRCTSDGNVIGRPYLNRPLALVGRRESCKYQFTTRSISPEHCALYQQDGKLWVIDFQTTGKTKLDRNVIECGLLQNGSHLQIGRVRIKVYLGQTDPVSPPTESPSNDPTESQDSLIDADAQPSIDHVVTQGLIDERGDTPTPEKLTTSNDLLEIPLQSQHAENSLISTQRALEKLRAEQNKSRKKIQELQRNHAETLSELQVAQNQLETTEELLQHHSAESQRKESLNQQLENDLKKESEGHRQTLSQLNQSIRHLAELKIDRDSARSKLEELQNQHTEKQSRLMELENEMASTRTEANALRKAYDEAQLQWESQAKWQTQLKDQEAALQAEAQRLESERDQQRLHEQSLGTLESQLEERRRELESKTQQQEQLRQRDAAESKNLYHQYESRNKALSQRQDSIDEAAQVIETERTKLNRDQANLKMQQNQLHETEESLTDRAREQEQIDAKQTATQQKLDQRKAMLEQQTLSFNELRERIQREHHERVEKIRRLEDQVNQRQTDLTLQAEMLDEEKKQLAEEKNKTERIRSQRNAELKLAESEQQKWQAELAAREEELIAREGKISSAEERMKTDRKELDRYFAIDSTQRQVLANLSSIQKEKSLSNRIWSWLGFPFRNG